MLSPTLTLCVARIAVSLGFITGRSATLVSEAARLRFSRPSTQARSAIDAGDRRLVGVAGFGLGFPGAALSESDQLKTTFGVREILGQGDQFDSIYDELYQYASYEFALRYNRTILQHAKERAG